jgi:hypothetical protein
MLGIGLRALHMPSKHSATELIPQSYDLLAFEICVFTFSSVAQSAFLSSHSIP